MDVWLRVGLGFSRAEGVEKKSRVKKAGSRVKVGSEAREAEREASQAGFED